MLLMQLQKTQSKNKQNKGCVLMGACPSFKKTTMDKEIHIYNYNDPKQSGSGSHGYFSRGQLLIVILAVLISPCLAIATFKACSGSHYETQPKEAVEKPKQQEAVPAQQPVMEYSKESFPSCKVTSSGATETTVTTSVVSSPYTWQYELKDVICNDGVRVNIKIDVTSQIKEGMEKLLLQNYGGNWFYTVFVAPFSVNVKANVRKDFLVNDLKYRLREVKFEQQLTSMANMTVQQLSEASLLPVDIKNVRVVEVTVLP